MSELVCLRAAPDVLPEHIRQAILEHTVFVEGDGPLRTYVMPRHVVEAVQDMVLRYQLGERVAFIHRVSESTHSRKPYSPGRTSIPTTALRATLRNLCQPPCV